MRRRNEIPRFENIDITNLIDILMVLLLTFMITIPPAVQKKEKVKLPEANVESQDMKADIEITVARDGVLYFSRKIPGQDSRPADAQSAASRQTESAIPLDLPSLKSMLIRENAGSTVRSAVINADENVPYEKVLAVVECLQSMKVPSINLAAAPRPDSGSKPLPPALSATDSSPPND